MVKALCIALLLVAGCSEEYKAEYRRREAAREAVPRTAEEWAWVRQCVRELRTTDHDVWGSTTAYCRRQARELYPAEADR